jgi:hypothetical protein
VPVGHQVNFFVMPADLPDIEAAIRGTGDVCFLGDRSLTAHPVELDTIAPEPGRLTCFIVQRQELAAVSTRFIATQGYWLIEDIRSPVIQFSPGLFTGSQLTRGRAYFASDLRFRPKLPSPGFVRWGDGVLARIKTKLTHHPEFATRLYFGASAMQWIQDSGATMTGGAAFYRHIYLYYQP